MKMLNFKKYLLTERLGINGDIKIITDNLYNLIKDSNKSKLSFDGKLFKTEKIKINNIIVSLFNFENAGTFESSDSKITDKGIDIFLNINKDYISKNVIMHELNHALQFYMIGKDNFIKKSNFLIKHRLSLKFLNDPIIESFFELVYFSDDSEIDSYASESYYEIKDNITSQIDNNITREKYNELFNFYYKNCYIYQISKELELFNFKGFKKLNSNNLIIFFNVLNDKEKLIDKIRVNKSKFKSILYSIRDILNNKYSSNSYYNHIDKSVTIENLDFILKEYDIRFKKASKKIQVKLSKLYDIILDDLIKENKVKKDK